MITLRSTRRSVLCGLAAAGILFLACDSSTAPPDELVGTWQATAIVVNGHDFTGDGMTLTYTLSANGGYSYAVTNDFFDYCDPGPNCSDSGDFEVSGNQITFDPGTDWEETYTYTLSGTTLTISASFGGATFTITFAKQ